MDQIISFLESAILFLSGIIETLLAFWWILLPVVLIFVGFGLWRLYMKQEYKGEMDWTLIEIKVPKEVEKTPKAMEQVFAAVHAIDTKVKFKDKWLKGKVANWITFELVGRAGSIRFIIRTPSDYKNLVESAIYSQYPEAEVNVLPPEEDYVNQFPTVLPNKEFDIAGAELVLKKEDGYPIRTYEYFEETKDEKRLDPMSSIMETMTKLKPSEAIWIQIILRPAGDDWVKEGEKLADKLWKNKKEKKKEPFPLNIITTIFEETFLFIRNFFIAFFEHPTWDYGESKEDSDSKDKLSPGKEEVVKGIENKISKLGFNGSIRFLYIDKRDEFTKSNVASVQGAFRQFSTNNMNTMDVNKEAMKGSVLLMTKNRREFQGKRKYYSNYINREFPDKTSVFNTEELATLYHFPLTHVKSPKLQKTDFRKGGPPSDLPTLE